MLHHLERYAAQHELAVKYGFKNKSCSFSIDIDANGELIDLRKIELTFSLAPDLSMQELVAGNIKKSHFLIDTRSVIEGSDETAEKHEYFIWLLEQAAKVQENIAPCALFLKNQQEMLKFSNILDVKKVKPTDKLTFNVEGEYPVKSQQWHDWWQRFKRELFTGKAVKKEREDMLCLLYGTSCEPVKSHSKINISRAGGMSIGSVLVGFDKDSFGSYGLKASAKRCRLIVLSPPTRGRGLKRHPRCCCHP